MITNVNHSGSSQCIYTEWMQLPILMVWPKSNTSFCYEECIGMVALPDITKCVVLNVWQLTASTGTL
jgi:hypothetical protein